MTMNVYDNDGLRRDSMKVRQSDNFKLNQPDVWYYEDRIGLRIYTLHGNFIIPRRQVLSYARVAESL